MLSALYEKLQQQSQAAVVIISVSLMLLCGFLMSRVTKKLRLPNVTGYIIAGIIIGPFCLDIIPVEMIGAMEFLSDIALALIAFGTGEFLKFSKLKSSFGKVGVITVAEALTASLFVFFALYFVLKLDFALSLILSALACATAPASTMMTIKQTGSRGDFVDTLLQVVLFDDVVALVFYSAAISAALSFMQGSAFSFVEILLPVLKNIAVFSLGAVFGFVMKLCTKGNSDESRLIIAVSMLFAFCSICALLEVSPLLGCMSMGCVYTNLSKDDRLLKQLNYLSLPVLLLFFVRSGMSFNFDLLLNPASAVGNFSLLFVGTVYFLVRILGKYTGAFFGCFLAKKPRETRNYFGLALIPQAGVAIGLADLGSRAIKGEAGELLQTVILASSVLYELIGPACAKLSLYLSKAYTLDGRAEIEETAQKLNPMTCAELLTERIKSIQKELPEPDLPQYQQTYEAEGRPKNRFLEFSSFGNIFAGKKL